MILFHGQRLVNYNFLCVASVIKKENTKIYYLVVVIMIEKKFFLCKEFLQEFCNFSD